MAVILVADDELAIVQTLTLLLNMEQHHVIGAANGADALDAARKAPPDIIVTDIMMPRLNGLDLCRALQSDERLRHIPVILMTASPTHVGNGAGCRYAGLLIKPFEFDDLMRTLATALGDAHVD
ncbi:MAG: response regulator [Myxococcales bacterium]|nr:response regulator [Myxococcales bacterium]